MDLLGFRSSHDYSLLPLFLFFDTFLVYTFISEPLLPGSLQWILPASNYRAGHDSFHLPGCLRTTLSIGTVSVCAGDSYP